MKFLNGYKTYLASAATILISLSSLVGFISPTKGVALATLCIGVAQLFQRMASAATVDKLIADLRAVLSK